MQGFTNKYTPEYFNAVALGEIPNTSIVNKFGRNPDVDTAGEEDVWNGGGDYTGMPAAFTAETIECFSSSASDTSAGTGARTIKVQALTAAGVWVQVSFTLNGTTAVAPDSPYTSTQFTRVHTAFVDTVGSGGFNVGTLTIRHTTTTANIFCQMPIGRNQTAVAAYTILAGYVGLLIKRGLSVVNNTNPSASNIEAVIAVREQNKAWRYRRPVEVAGSGGVYQAEITGGFVLPAYTDIKLRVMTCSQNNTIVTGYFDIYLEQS